MTRDPGPRIVPRKMAQLCTQIRRALEFALLGSVHDDALIDVEVSAVTPMPDPGRVRVTFVAHGARPDIPDLTARLEAVRGLLTAEVVQAITRKRVPDMIFEVGPAEARTDDRAGDRADDRAEDGADDRAEDGEEE